MHQKLPAALAAYTYNAALCEGAAATRDMRWADIHTFVDAWLAHYQTPLDPATCTAEQVRALLAVIAAQPGTGPARVDRIIQSGRACWAWLIANAGYTDNPFAAIPAQRVKQRSAASAANQILLATLLDECARDDTLAGRRLAVMLWLTWAGLRPSEIRMSLCEDIDRVQGVIAIRDLRWDVRCCGRLPVEALTAIDAYHRLMPLPPTGSDAIIGFRGAHYWYRLSVDTIRRHYHALRSACVAQLTAKATASLCPDGQQALLRVAAGIASSELDDLRT
jgi:site-specific recombinase XerC